jgi:hypothetical protein
MMSAAAPAEPIADGAIDEETDALSFPSDEPPLFELVAVVAVYFCP